MKILRSISPLLLLLPFLACATSPAYVKNDARARQSGVKRWGDSKSPELSPVALKSRKTRAAKLAVSASLKKDNECAILHDSLKSLRNQDASIRAFTAKFGETETRAMAKRVQRNYEVKGCASWLDQHGGVGSAWRRVRVAQWTSFRIN